MLSLPCPPELWREFSRLLGEVLDLPIDERGRWLDSLAQRHAHFRSALARVVAHAAALDGSDFLSAPQVDGEALSGLRAGERVGPYVLERELGSGGMGVVWLATRSDGNLKRRIALKLPHAHLLTPTLRQRFERERDILASLSHPHIARLFDAGFGEDQQPYLALEYVEGAPITEYCDREKLTIRQRLQLFLEVLEAVQYAHSRLVIHRDVKPSNILVTPDRKGILVDFGIAKLIVDGEAKETELTQQAGRALTPDYASPEQILGQTVSTASDVYSLAVVMYELLCGSKPYRMKRASPAALEEAILGIDPMRPSQSPISTANAAVRGTSARDLARSLAGDLDTIVLKGLKKAPADRYATVDAFEQDIRRYLGGQPVLAQPDSAWYRTGKFIRRNRLPVALAAALALVVCGGLGVALWGLHSARTQAERAEAAKSFLLKVFSTGNPSKTDGQNITAREILERGSKQIDAELQKQPALLGELHSEIANIYSSIGANEDVQHHAIKAAELLESSGTRNGDAYFNALYRIASSYKEEEHWPEARAAYQRLRGAATRQFGPANPWEARTLEDMIWVEQSNGDLLQAQAAAAGALDLTNRLYGQHSSQYLRVLGSSEQLYLDRGQPKEALQFIQKVIELSSSVPDYALADRLMDRYMLASTLYRLQRYQESAQELRRLVPDMESNMGLGNDRTSKARNTLALDLAFMGELQEAEAIQRRNLKLLDESHIGDQDLLTGQKATLARILFRSDRFAESIPLQQQVVEYFDHKYASPTTFHEHTRSSLGDMRVRDGDIARGVAGLERAIANLNSIKDYRPDPIFAETLQAQGNGYRLLGRTVDAQESLASACALYDSLLGENSVAAHRCRLYKLLVKAENVDRAGAKSLLIELSAIRDRLNILLPPHQALRAELQLIEAALDRTSGDNATANALEREAIASYQTLVGLPPHLPLRGLH